MSVTATAPQTGTNYVANRQFGNYPRGTVFPRWRLACAGDVDDMVKRGMVAPTLDPVVLKFEVPKLAEVPTEPIPDADTQKALNAASDELATLRGENEALRAQVGELERQQIARLHEWGRATDQHAFERATDAAKVRAAEDAAGAVRAELRTCQDRIADLEKKLSAGERPKKVKSDAPPAPTE